MKVILNNLLLPSRALGYLYSDQVFNSSRQDKIGKKKGEKR